MQLPLLLCSPCVYAIMIFFSCLIWNFLGQQTKGDLVNVSCSPVSVMTMLVCPPTHDNITTTSHVLNNPSDSPSFVADAKG